MKNFIWHVSSHIAPDRMERAGRVGASVLVALAVTACAVATPPPPREPAADSVAKVGDTLGISVRGLHLSAHGYLLDLRYRVTDPAKAIAMLESKHKVQLVDVSRGARLGIPESPVIGPMRQTARNHVLYQDRDYFVLFVNPGRAVRTGELVQLAVDGQPLAVLRVE
jgi:hypothetical protein